MMQNLGSPTSPDITMIISENLVVTIKRMGKWFPTVCSRVINGFFISITILYTIGYMA